MSGQYWKKWFKESLLTKYHSSLNNPSRANGDFCEQIFARDCYNSRETEKVTLSNRLSKKQYEFNNTFLASEVIQYYPLTLEWPFAGEQNCVITDKKTNL